eukprot:1413719-Pleurochrysis_carterae.AAC.1
MPKRVQAFKSRIQGCPHQDCCVRASTPGVPDVASPTSFGSPLPHTSPSGEQYLSQNCGAAPRARAKHTGRRKKPRTKRGLRRFGPQNVRRRFFSRERHSTAALKVG